MKISKEFKIGLVVLLSVAVLYVGFNYLKGINKFGSQQRYYALYGDVANLNEANPVLLNGFKVGQVVEMKLLHDGTGRILVGYIISEKALKIPADSRFRIYSSDLLGSKAVQLQLGTSGDLAQPGDTLASDVEESLSESVNKQILPLKNKAEDLISNIDSAMITLNAILNKETQDDLSKSFTSISDALASFKKTAYRLDTLLIQERIKISAILANMESITGNLENNSENISAILQNFESVSDSLAKADIKATVDNAKSAMEGASTIMDKINNGEGSIGLLINNDSLYNNLANASLELEWLLEDVRLHPNRYVHFSVFGKKEGKKLSKKDIEEIKQSINNP